MSGYFEISYTGGCSRVSSSRRQKKQKQIYTNSMAGTGMLTVKGCALEIVTDTTAAITNSTTERKKINRMHV